MSKASKKQATNNERPEKPVVHASSTSELTGYVRFTLDVFSLLKKHKSVFGKLLLVSLVVAILIAGTTMATEYSDLAASTEMYSGEVATGAGRTMVEVGVILASVLSGALTTVLGESQQVFMGAGLVFLWLSVVWLLRHQLSGADVRVRDALYNAGAPLLSTLAIVAIAVVQLLPLAIVATLLSSAISSGVLSGIFGVMLSLVIIVAMSGVTLYWLTTTAFAAIVVTIPGTYPWAALRSARQLIAGYRVSVLLRILWLALIMVLVFLVLVLPVVVIDRVLGASGSPFVPLVLQLVAVGLLIYGTAYVYMLYRSIIDERS